MSSTTPQRTPLYQNHVDLNAKMVDFGGWEMPIQYTSIMNEHNATRTGCGIFDVSHMTIVDLQGAGCREFLSHLVANDVAKLQQPGKALYTCMLNKQGGVIDDLIVYFMREDWFRLVVNAATRDKDIAWIKQQADGFDVTVTERAELAMIAVQGPEATDKLNDLLGDHAAKALELPPFNAIEMGDWFVARTGYTGEDGFEVVLPADKASDAWEKLIDNGATPIGLGARDTLRLEAGMNLYGHDMDETTSPLVSGLGWTVSMGHDFIGKTALQTEKDNGVQYKLVGLVLQGRGVLREGYKVITEHGDGVTTSGGFSPTMQQSIAFARVPAATGDEVQVEIRNKHLAAKVVKLPFVRKGEVLV